MTADSFTDGSGYYYVWDHYEPWYNNSDEFHFFVGSITYRNTSPNTQKMTYTQSVTHTSSWVTTGKVSAETEFGNSLIANAKYNVGFELQRSTITAAGTTFAGEANVSPNKTGQLSAYDAGGYSGGAGVWRKYSPSRTSLLGTYNETGDGWAVAANRKAFSYNEW